MAKPAAHLAGESAIHLARNGFKLVRTGKNLTWVLVRDHVTPKVKPHMEKLTPVKEFFAPGVDALGKVWNFGTQGAMSAW